MSDKSGVRDKPLTDTEILCWYEQLEDVTTNTNTPEQGIIAHVRELIRLTRLDEATWWADHDVKDYDTQSQWDEIAAMRVAELERKP
jgi:hypothetical protein